MVVSQTLRSSSTGDLGGLAKLFSSFCGHNPTALTPPWQRWIVLEGFLLLYLIPLLPRSFLRLVKTRLGLAENRLTPDTTRSSVQTFLPLASVEVPGTGVPPAHGWSGHRECMTRRETHSRPPATAVSFYKILLFLPILG